MVRIQNNTQQSNDRRDKKEQIKNNPMQKRKQKEIEVETFTWEKLDCQEEVKSAFGL
mgnify:CR=1 FL=1